MALVSFDEFVELVEEVHAIRPRWFEDVPADATATRQQLREAQARLGVELPDAYVAFVQRYGGGAFAFQEIYSLDPASPVNLLRQNSPPWSRPDFVAISDNGAGDLYGFAVRDGRCDAEVLWLDHETGTLAPTGHDDLLEFLAAGLREHL